MSTPQDRLDAMKAWKPSRLAQKAPKPVTMPKPFDWNQKFTPRYPVRGHTVADTLRLDPYDNAPWQTIYQYSDNPAEYIREWDTARGLKPVTYQWVTPTLGSFA